MRTSSFMIRGCLKGGVLTSSKPTAADFAFESGDVLLCASSGAAYDPSVHPDPHTFTADRFLVAGKFVPPKSSQLVICASRPARIR